MPVMGRRRFIGGVGAGIASLTGCSGGQDRLPARDAPVRQQLPAYIQGRRSVPGTQLPRRIAFANTSDAEIFTELGHGYSRAAAQRGLDFVTANAHGDGMQNVTQLSSLVSLGLGALLVQPLSWDSQRRSMATALRAGILVQAIITDPCILQVVTDHYRTGWVMGRAAADYAAARLGRTAVVINFNQDGLSVGLGQRHRGILDGLRTGGPGVRVVADVHAPDEMTIQSGYSAMLHLFQQHADVQIVLGPDTIVVGAYRAVQSIGAMHNDMYFAGTDGHPDALELVSEGRTYRASYAFPWELLGYTLGQSAADWIEGWEVPRALVIENIELTSSGEVDRFRSANTDPAATLAGPDQLATYLHLLGNVGFADRGLIWNGPYEPWPMSEERGR